MKILALKLVLLLPAGPGCQRSGAKWRGTIEERDGVAYVHNPRTPQHEGDVLSLVEELSIGRENGPPEYVFSSINGIDVDAAGTVYAIDDSDANIRVYDAAGAFLRTIGRKGQGPGEMLRPLFIRVTPRNEIAVTDWGLPGMLCFSPEGEFLYQKRKMFLVQPVGMDTRGNFIAYEAPAPPPGGGKVIKRFDADLNLIAEIAREPMGERRLFDIGKPSCFCALDPNDNIVWGDSGEYALTVLSPQGKVIRRISRDYSPRAIVGANRDEFRARYAEPLKHGLTISFRSHFPAFSGMSIDDDGRIFVKTYERASSRGIGGGASGAGGGPDSFMFDVFSREGIYLASVPIAANLDRTAVWKNHKLYTIETDARGFQTVKRFAGKWKY